MARYKNNTNGVTIEGKNLKVTDLSRTLGDFQAIGRINHMGTKHKPEKTDIFDALNSVSKSAYSVFNDIKNNRTWWNNTAHVDMKGMTVSQKVMLRDRLKELKNADIIRKARSISELDNIKKGSFMINPHLLKCNEHQKTAIATWELLHPKRV